MKLRPLAILLTVPLWACAAKPDSDPLSTTLSVVETPFLIAFKVPVCLGTVLLAPPGAAVSAAIPFKDASKGTGVSLYTNSVSDACGPPYVATPQYGMRQ